MSTETIVFPIGNIITESLATFSVVGIAALSTRRTAKKPRVVRPLELMPEKPRQEKSRLERLEALLEERRWVSMKEASEVTGVEIASIKELFSDLMKKNPTLQGFFVDDMFVLKSVEEI